MPDHRINRACGRQLKGPIYAEEMGIEVHAIYASHRTVVVQNKTVLFDPGYSLRLAAALAVGHVLAVRSDRESFFKQGFKSNLPLTGAVLLTFVLQLGTIYIPVVNEKVFKTQPLTWDELLVALAISSVVFWGVELEKLIKRRIDAKSAAVAA